MLLIEKLDYCINGKHIKFILIQLAFLISICFILFAPEAGLFTQIFSQSKHKSFHRQISESSSSSLINNKNLVILKLKSKCNCKFKQQINVIKNNVENNYEIWLNKEKLLYNLTNLEYDSLNVTCDLYNVLRRGKNQKVISYSLYGKSDRYYRFLHPLIMTIKRYYPTWLMRVYYDDSIDLNKICEIECAIEKKTGLMLDNADFCNSNSLNLKLNNVNLLLNASYMHSMKWRWLPMGDSFVNIFMSRDTDSLILQREIDAVKDWLNRSTVVHIMRDSSSHPQEMLGGMWGFRNDLNRRLANHIYGLITNRNISKFYNFNNKSQRGHDQFFLRDHVYPLIKFNSTQHDSYFCESFKNLTIPFPTERVGNCFVGGTSWACFGTNRSLSTCPLECRPKDHPDWTSC